MKDQSEPGASAGAHNTEGPAGTGAIGRLAVHARAMFASERGLTALGGVGLVIAFVCLVGVGVHGPLVPPEGKMLDAATFTFGVAIFTLTMALLLPMAGYSETGRRRWRAAYAMFAAYGLVVEPVQAFRGLDPRFTQVGGVVDQIAGAVFGLTALVLTVAFVFLGLRFFRSDVLEDRPILRTGIRYGTVAVWMSFGVGIAMSVNAGRQVGDAGDLMLTHALGVHGIQAVPAVALLLIWATAVSRSSGWIHVAGAGWLAACTAALLQSLVGRPPLETSAFPVAMVAGLVVWAIVGGYARRSWRRPPNVHGATPAR